MAAKTTTTAASEKPEPKNLGEALDQMKDEAPPTFTAPLPWSQRGLGVYQGISMVMSDLGTDGIPKDKQTTQGGSFRYRGVDQVYAALNPLLVKHNLVLLPRYRNRRVEERRSSNGNALFNVTVEAEFDVVCTTDGSKVTISTIGEAFDSGDKATNKAMAVAFKYAAFILFCIPVEGENTDDPDATVHTVKAKDTTRDAATHQRVGQPPGATLTNEQAEANYKQAVKLLEDCATEGELAEVWDHKIKWNGIPQAWHKNLAGVRRAHSQAISRPKQEDQPPPPASTPSFDATGMDDDIPF